MTGTKTWFGRLGGASVLAACLLIQPAPPIAAQGQLVLKVATSAHADSPWGHALQRFGAYVQQRSQGRIRVRVFYEGALGPDTSQVERVIAGTLQAYAGPVEALYPSVKALQSIETPYLFGSEREAGRALRGATGSMESQLSAAGLRFGYWQPRGFRSWFSTTDPIRNERDLHGATEATFVDAVQHGLHLRARHITLTHHAYAAGILVYSQRWFDGLPAQTQEFLGNLPTDVAGPIAAELGQVETQLIEAMKQRGIDVHVPDVAEARSLGRSLRAANDSYLRGLSEPARVLYRKLRAHP